MTPERLAQLRWAATALELLDEIDRLRAALRFYVDNVPAFRSKPIGALGSASRRQQDEHIAAENAARAALGDTPC